MKKLLLFLFVINLLFGNALRAVEKKNIAVGVFGLAMFSYSAYQFKKNADNQRSKIVLRNSMKKSISEINTIQENNKEGNKNILQDAYNHLTLKGFENEFRGFNYSNPFLPAENQKITNLKKIFKTSSQR